MVEFFQKKNVFLIAILIIVAAFIGIISAGFQVGSGEGGYFIEKIYGPEFNLKGWVNISFIEEPLNSLFEDSFGNSITLEKFLGINPSYDYSCNFKNCPEDYSSSNGENVKVVNLNSGNTELAGFVLTGNIISINNITFDVESDGSENSCTSPLKLDVLDDGIIESQSNVLVNELCDPDEKDYGCFNVTQTVGVEEFNLISGSTYCQRINLSESPGFRIGAWVKELTASSELNMSLYKENALVASCTLPSIITPEEYSCDIDYATSGGDHYVCISSGAGTGDYSIKGSNSAEKCGFFGKPIKGEFASYQIFAKSKKFGIPGTQNIVDDLGDGRSLSVIVGDYIAEKYGTSGGVIQCSTGVGCIIPLNIISGLDQQITLKNLLIKYEKQSGIVTNNKFYDLIKVPAKVSSGFQKLYMDNAGFTLPEDLGEYNFSLSLNGDVVFSEDIEIKNAPIINSLKPTETASAYPTEFEVKTSNSSKITKYEWDFGDDSSEVTTIKNKITHTYSSIGVYDLKITVTDSKDISSSKIFSINVSSPKNLIEDSLAKLNSNIEKIKEDINKIDLFYKQGIISILDLDSIEENVKVFEKAFDSAVDEEDYNAIIIDLIKIQIPQGIIKTVSAEGVSFFDTTENVKMDILKEIGGGDYESKEDAYKNSVLIWQNENVDLKVSFQEFSSEQNSIEPLIRIFEIDISEKKNIDYDYYLVIPDLENIGFKNNLQTQGNGYSYFILKGNSRVSFYTTEDIDFTNLPVFVAPPISRLSVTGDLIVGDERESRSRLIVTLVIILLVVLSLTVYIIMQEWYKRKYETYLFKNKNDLYNMVNYVNSAKRKGLKKGEIEKNLKKAGWSSEKVRFVMRKYAGKRTGMFEIPIKRVVDKVDKNSKNKTTT